MTIEQDRADLEDAMADELLGRPLDEHQRGTPRRAEDRAALARLERIEVAARTLLDLAPGDDDRAAVDALAAALGSTDG